MCAQADRVEARLWLVTDLMETAVARLRAAGRRKAPERPRRRTTTLQPGLNTPVWNELVRSAVPYLRKRGDKVKLARLLGLPRQRIHQLLVEKSACADAERTLLLLAWVAVRRAGKHWV